MGVLRPEGSLPARVYWVRRAVVLLVLVAVVVLLVLGVRALLGGSDPEGTPAPTSPTTAATDGKSDAEAASTPACDAAALGVTLAADGTTYGAGALPTFTITLVNDGEQPCLVDAGEAQRQILITSGSDRIWASTDCGGTDPMPLLLAPGEPDERQVQWDRNRSVEGCATGQAAALPGTYQAVLTLAGVTTEPVVFGLE
ncbi:hypothetical protein CHO01_21640 [Cellulomonas hominis]|jgi:hypothetical protein|uniref:Uncharacterized protein n=1 Tax=Cellulomonas hominis TaxID=156981 RepID=A0A511FGR2_9CELL|nr:hypothetical protein [Cellulomonas hominis]MBB5473633.1 hypothetical protein [Cellulomonas hominis]NKY11233.1 hypothetical protein [Cellulomonas hominis]GEL47048.1 hypothetical protein CHO01_21640 [Cellulomonas hominis]